MLVGDYSGVNLARPGTPIDPKGELLRNLVYPAPKRLTNQLTTQLSFEFHDTKKYFRKKTRKLVKKLSNPSLADLRRLKPETIEKLKKFKDFDITIRRNNFKGPNPSPTNEFDSVISIGHLFGDEPILLVSTRLNRTNLCNGLNHSGSVLINNLSENEK